MRDRVGGELNMSMVIRLAAAAFAAALCVPSLASAADPDEGALEGGLEQDGLEEKKVRAAKTGPTDPDQGSLDKVEARRKEVQAFLNEMQEKIGQPMDGLTAKDAKVWDKLVSSSNKLVSSFLAAQDKFIEAHRSLLDAYQGAVSAGNAVESEKHAKAIAKLRSDVLKADDKLEKDGLALKVKWEEFLARVAASAEK
jgi:hypothetical protein